MMAGCLQQRELALQAEVAFVRRLVDMYLHGVTATNNPLHAVLGSW